MGSTPLYLADRYRLYERIGTGSFATVWLAWDEVLARLVAVKVLKDSRAVVPGFRTRFLEQVREVARLSHPALVAVHDFGESEVPPGAPLPYVVMELLSGEALASRLGRGPLPLRMAFRICEQVASALAYAHAAGTAYYDLESSNVFLTDGGPKVLGVGTGKVVGRPVGDAAAQDVRALGLLLSAAVTGRVDSAAELPAELPAEVPVEVAAVQARCLLPEPAARPLAAEVAAVLAEAVEPRRPAASNGAGTLARRARRAVHRRPRLLWLTVVPASVLVVVAILVLLWGGSAERVPAPTMQVEAPTNVPGTATASAGPTSSPGESPTDGATESPSATAEPTRKAGPRPAPADPVEVLSRAQRFVDEGVAEHEIRSDVGVDLDNVLGNLRRDLQQNSSVDLRARLAEIHNKISTRLGEKALTSSRAERLHAILDEIRV
jgi:serine/threonine-protein kinase